MPSKLGITLAGIFDSQFDPDALNFITTASITDATQRYAINNLVTDLKINNIWSKMKAIYPMVGGNATSHSYNLKNVAQYQLTFNGGWTHNSTGAIPNGTNAYAQTGLNASSVLSGTSNHLSFYSLTNSPAGAGTGKVDIGCQIGATTSYFVSISDYALFIAYMYSNAVGARIQIAQGTTAAGLVLATVQSASSFKTFTNRYASSVEGFVQNAQITSVQGSLPNNEVYLCANGYTGNIYDYSNRGCGIATIGDGLTDSDVQNFGAIVQRYVNTVGRQQISVPTVQDLDAFSFLVSAGITDSTQATAVQNLTSSLKYYGLWDKMQAVYPFVGAVSTSQRTNLKSPANLDASFRLTFSGGWTHSTNGALPNGTNGFANTYYIPNTSGSLNDAHASIYLRTNTAVNAKDFGVSQGSPTRQTYVSARDTANQQAWGLNSGSVDVGNQPNSQGLWTVTRSDATNVLGYKNGTLLNTNALASTARPTVPYYFGAFNNNGTAQQFSNRQFAYVSFGLGLSGTDITNLYTVVQAYQTELSRQV